MNNSIHDIEYWKRLSERYRHQRDMAVREIQSLQKQLYLATGCAKDGHDYLRQIRATKTTRATAIGERIKNFIGALR
jgi:hypothetical protein